MTNLKILGILNLILALGVIVFLVVKSFDSPTHVYVVNQELFTGFKGSEELSKRLESIKSTHRDVLDSIYNLPRDENSLKLFYQKQEKFESDEQTLVNRYEEQVWQQINTYIHEYGDENGYDMILGANGNGSLMYARDSRNITKEVLKYLNNKYDGDL